MLDFLVWVYTAGSVIAYPIAVCSNYAYFQRKYPILAEKGRSSDSWDSIFVELIAFMLWPVILPLHYSLTEKFKYGFAIPFTDPFKGDKYGNRQAAQAGGSYSINTTTPWPGRTGPGQNSGGPGAGPGAGASQTRPPLVINRIKAMNAARMQQLAQQQALSSQLQQAYQNQNAQAQLAYNQAMAAMAQSMAGQGSMPQPSDFKWEEPEPLPRETKFGELIGWRAWRVLKGGALQSCVVPDVWLPGIPMEGTIHLEYVAGEGGGIHAYKNEPHKLWYSGDPSSCDSQTINFAMGSVWLYGDVVEHEDGYRASHAMVRSIDGLTATDDALLEKLRKRYVPNS